ncbi:DsbA family protein [Asticcacaulis sp.]|uniref:DsbA family protein n=1 Tax=Asticcacaulis sp. TaxID=1872648 RepID=UPI002BCF1746|nr:DsbA family protein [Asticcacaulis sp.]HTM79568.1 DsbA family protein [Asticcacaulis sp.]
MTEPKITTEKSTSLLKDLFSQANITTGLAVFAVVLAGAPYVVPQVQSFVVQKGLMSHPAMLYEASAKLNSQNEADKAKTMATAIKSKHDSLFNDKADPILGNPNAKIKIVEFLDYNCGYCRAATPVLKDFLAKNPDVAIVVKEYPVINQNSRPLAAFALGAAQAGKYEAVHYALMTEQVGSEAEMTALLGKLGLDPATVKANAASAEVKAHIDKVLQLGADLQITGTPTFIIGNTVIDGAKLDELEKAVAAARSGK